jgi:hypothetical protein
MIYPDVQTCKMLTLVNGCSSTRADHEARQRSGHMHIWDPQQLSTPQKEVQLFCSSGGLVPKPPETTAAGVTTAGRREYRVANPSTDNRRIKGVLAR